MARTSQNRKLSGPIEIGKRSIAFYKLHSDALIRVISVQFWAIILLIIALGFVGTLMAVYNFAPVTIAGGVALISLFLIGSMVVVGNKITLIQRIDDLAFGKKTRKTVWAATRENMDRFWSYVWYSILLMLVLLGAFMIGLGVFSIFTYTAFAIFFIFSLYTFVLEDRKGLEALTSSWQYVVDYWWAIFGRVVFLILVGFFVGLIWSGITFAVYYLGYQAWGTFSHFSQFQSSLAGNVMSAVGQMLMLFVGMPLISIYFYGLYSELKQLKGEDAPDMHPAKILWCKILGIIGVICIPALIVLGVILSVTAVYFKERFERLPLELNAEVVYKDREHNISFSYPGNWHSTTIPIGGVNLKYWTKSNGTNDIFPETMTFSAVPIADEILKMSDEKYLNKLANDIKTEKADRPGFEVYTTLISDMGEKEAFRVLYTESILYNSKTVQVVTELIAFRHNGRQYVFTFTDNPEDMSGTEDAFINTVNSIMFEGQK